MRHDDRHDRGLVYDLATLRARAAAPLHAARLERRTALKLLGAGGLGLVLAACGKSSDSASGASSSPSSTAGAGGTTAGTSTGTTGAIPEETGGPFPGDGSNGPDVLHQSGVVRKDLRPSFGSMSGTAGGIPVSMDLTVLDAATGDPRSGAAMYLWHCTREGGYSLYSEGVTDQNFLRGVQATDASGHLSFVTVFPAAYDGRWPHMHFEVFETLDAITSGRKLVTSQLAMPKDVCTAVYATEAYEASVANLARTSLDTDMVFSDGYSLQVPTITGDVAKGLTLTHTIAV